MRSVGELAARYRHADSAQALTPEDASGLENMRQLIQLRWIAVVGQIITIGLVHFAFDIDLPLRQMAVVLLCLIAFNIGSLLHWRSHRGVSNGELFLALLVDVATLAAQLYLSGGAANPFCFLYLLQVILGAILLKAGSVWTMVLITVGCFTGLAVFGRPLALPAGYYDLLFGPYISGLLICFALDAGLLVIFVTRINRNLRARDARLAALRERAAEEEHIVRMGLLASGAAHELGTPLSTVAVILGDWRRMPALAGNAELLQEIDEMQAQVLRCKSIVSGILLSAGETRAETPVEASLCEFLNELVREWRETRPVARFEYVNRIGEDLHIVADSAIRQMIYNVLDNALEASPGWVGFEVAREGDLLELTVNDQGPGFAPEMLAQLGKPYQSSKGRPGAGLGLFLVSNVARTLQGRVAARNRDEGGASVTLTLPLEELRFEEEDVDDG